MGVFVTNLCSQNDLSVSRHEQRAEGVFTGHGTDHLQSRPVRGKDINLLDHHHMTKSFPLMLGLKHFHLFHTFTVSPEAERMAKLSELKASVRTSVRWPPSVRRVVLLLVGVLSIVFKL